MSDLHRAARSQRQYQRIIDAFRAGASLDVRDERGATPLHCALLECVSSTVSPVPALTLLALGAAPDLADEAGVRPLHLACAGAKTEVTRLLLALGADPQRPDGQGRAPADHLAASRSPFTNHKDTIAAWLAGAPLGLRTEQPLYTASPAEAAYRLRHGADPDARDRRGNTALHRTDSAAIVAALLARGADPNLANRRGETPLHLACRGLGMEITLLMNSGADPTLQDAKGRLPVDGLHAQSYEDDFHDGGRLEGARQHFIARLSRR